MSLFEITTESVFKNKYIIEADSLNEAIERVKDNDNPPDFYQNHRHEGVIGTIELCSGDPTEDDIKIAKNNVRSQGYV